MPEPSVVEGRILEWGNSYGIRLRADTVRSLGLEPGDDVTVRIERDQGCVDVSGVRSFEGGRSDVSQRHDEILGEALAEDHTSEEDA